MSNDYLPVFLYRWTDNSSTVSFGAQRKFVQHYPHTVIGVATRPVRTTIDHMDATPEYAEQRRDEFQNHVEEVANDVRWFNEPMECNP